MRFIMRHGAGQAGLAATLLFASAGVLQAQNDSPYSGGTPGGAVTYQGGTVTLSLLFQEALFNNQLFIFRSVGAPNTFSAANAISIFSNKAPIGTTVTIDPAASLGLAAGDELIFAICTNLPAGTPPNGQPAISCGTFGNANSVLYSGAGSRNFDNLVHAITGMSCADLARCSAVPAGTTVVAFEDIRGVDPSFPVQDRDFDDIVFSVTQSPATVVPEPVTMALLATGLAGMGGAGVFRRRK